MKTIISFSFILGLVFFASADLRGNESFSFPVQYSAEQTTAADGKIIKSEIYADGEKIRLEINAEGMDMVTIMRKDQNVCYTLMPAEKMCMVVPLKSLGKTVDYLPSANTKLTFVGKETIKSIVCDKYKLSVEKEDYFMWVDASNKMPVRRTSADGNITVDWDHFKIAPQPADLFEVPADYKKMDMGAFQK